MFYKLLYCTKKRKSSVNKHSIQVLIYFSLQKYIIKSSHRNIEAGTIENSSSSRDPSKQQLWLPHQQPSREQGSQQLILGLTAWSHTQLQHDSPGTGWGGAGQEPPGPWVSLWGQPQSEEQPGVLLSASSSPKPKGTQSCCRGCVTPQTSQSTKVFIPARIPPLLAASAPCPSSTQVPPAPRRHNTPGSTGCWWGVQGLSGSSQLGRIRPPQGQDVHPTPQDVTLLPIPPSPEPSSAPRMSLALGGPGTIPCAGSWESTGKPQVGNSL